MAPCALCGNARALLRRPKTLQPTCRECFFAVFEQEIHHTILGTGLRERQHAGSAAHGGASRRSPLFRRGERVAIGASGGKDSTVLAYVLKLLNDRHDYGLDLCLLSIDEGISGYRDDSLETVKRNAEQYDLPLKILSYKELYSGWTMDRVVSTIGKKGNCTYCGVFRRQALDRGAHLLDVDHVVTGHNADDVAETVLMNVLRGDLPRLERCTNITTGQDLPPLRKTSSPSSLLGPATANEVRKCGGAHDEGRAMAEEEDAEDELDRLLPRTIKRSKPFKYAYEKEIVLYAYFKKLDYHSTECIYSPTAYRGYARALVKDLEATRPSAIIDLIYSGEAIALSLSLPGRRAGDDFGGGASHSKRGGAAQGSAASKSKLQTQRKCERCGAMTSQTLCQACVLLESLNKGVAKIDMSTAG